MSPLLVTNISVDFVTFAGDGPSQRQSDQQSPDEQRRHSQAPTANLQLPPFRSAPTAAPVSRMVLRSQGLAAGGPYQSFADMDATSADGPWGSLQEVYEAAIEAVTEAAEYDPDVDMSAMDQRKGSRCDLDVRMAHTLKYALPAALASEHRPCAQSGIGQGS